MNYDSTDTPKNYICAQCGAAHVKLWRDYMRVDLLCCDCAAADQHCDISAMTEDGRSPHRATGAITNQIGWYVPAVPSSHVGAYWGYTSVPQAGVDWWHRLPLRSIGGANNN